MVSTWDEVTSHIYYSVHIVENHWKKYSQSAVHRQVVNILKPVGSGDTEYRSYHKYVPVLWHRTTKEFIEEVKAQSHICGISEFFKDMYSSRQGSADDILE
jgi:hypothetical protein